MHVALQCRQKHQWAEIRCGLGCHRGFAPGGVVCCTEVEDVPQYGTTSNLVVLKSNIDGGEPCFKGKIIRHSEPRVLEQIDRIWWRSLPKQQTRRNEAVEHS